MLTLSLENFKKLYKQFCSRTQKFWPDLLLHMATKQDRDSFLTKNRCLPEKTVPVSIIILQPSTFAKIYTQKGVNPTLKIFN